MSQSKESAQKELLDLKKNMEPQPIGTPLVTTAAPPAPPSIRWSPIPFDVAVDIVDRQTPVYALKHTHELEISSDIKSGVPTTTRHKRRNNVLKKVTEDSTPINDWKIEKKHKLISSIETLNKEHGTHMSSNASAAASSTIIKNIAANQPSDFQAVVTQQLPPSAGTAAASTEVVANEKRAGLVAFAHSGQRSAFVRVHDGTDTTNSNSSNTTSTNSTTVSLCRIASTQNPQLT